MPSSRETETSDKQTETDDKIVRSSPTVRHDQPDSLTGSKTATDIGTKSPYDLQYRQLVSRLRLYVLKDRNLAKPDISRDELITALSTNRTTLSAAVRAVTNSTLMEYINILQLEKAEHMLDTHPELTIEAIAETCGFNLRTFHRLFFERYGITPAKYRKIHIIDPMTYELTS